MKLSTRKRDREILRLLGQGKEAKEIAGEIHITIWTVYDAVRRRKAELKGAGKHGKHK